MQRQSQYRLDSLHRVQAFLDTHVDVLGALNKTEARKQLDDAASAATVHENDRGSADRALAGAGEEVKRLAASLIADHMVPVAKFARANLRGVPNFKALTHAPANRRGPSLVGAANAMATAAAPYADRLAKAQFPAESIKQLSDAAGALKAALDTREAAKSKRIVATAGVRNQLQLGREAVAKLDPIVHKLIAKQPELKAGWRSARRMTLMPQSGAAAAVPAGTTTTPATPAPVTTTAPATAPVASAPVAKEVKAA